MITDPRLHPSRAQLNPGEVLCQFCTAKCCRYYSLPMEQPKTRKDFDYIRWFLMHGRSAVYIEDGTWYLLVFSDCQHLLPDNRCGIYETRPRICRGYDTSNCEFHGEEYRYEHMFTSADQIQRYAEKELGRSILFKPRRKGPKLRRGRNGARRVELPIA